MMPKSKRTQVRTQVSISIRGSTYEKLQEAARKNGEQISTLVDAIVNKWLDEQERRS